MKRTTTRPTSVRAVASIVGVGVCLALTVLLLAAFSTPQAFAAAAGTTRYQQTDSRLSYAGSWSTFSTTSASGGSYKRANSNASSVTVTFDGTYLAWIATKGTTLGKAFVSLDGGATVGINLAASTVAYQQSVWNTGTLSSGSHTVKIWRDPSSASGKYFSVDAFDVSGTLTVQTSGSSSGTAYYVDATGGNDSNSGLAPGSAWKTFYHVNHNAFSPGDTILFKRGEVFRGQFSFQTSKTSGAAGLPITIDAYGSGAKPVWMGSVDLSSSTLWASRGGNIWRATGLSTDVGNLICNQEAVIGSKQSSATALKTQGDFYYSSSGDYIDVYSAGNPGTYYSHIEAAQKLSTLAGTGGNILGNDHSYITIRNIGIKYQGWHGLTIGGGASHIVVEDCDFSWCGGSYSSESGTERDGNGIMTALSQNDVTIRDNTFNNIWEVSVSLQSWGTTTESIKKVYIYRNVIANTRGSGTELWVDSGSPTTSSELYWANNVFYNIGKSVLTRQASGATSRAFNLNKLGSVSSSYILNNVFYGTSGWYLYMPSASLTGWQIDYNDYYPENSYFMRGTGSYSLSQWKTLTGKDAHSFSADPKFVSAASGNFALGTGSPCLGTGTAVTSIGQSSGSKPNLGIHY